MGREASINKLCCVRCKHKKVERVNDFFSSISDPKYDRVLQTIICEKCGGVSIAIYRLEVVYIGEDDV